MSSVEIRQVDADTVRPLRHRVLRCGRPAEESVYPVDDSADTVHLAAVDGDTVIGAATVFPEPYQGRPAWRLRGMAVAEERRAEGVGGQLLVAVCATVRDQGADLLWCNGRSTALDFYRRHGFTVVGDEFLAAGVPHRVAVLALRYA